MIRHRVFQVTKNNLYLSHASYSLSPFGPTNPRSSLPFASNQKRVVEPPKLPSLETRSPTVEAIYKGWFSFKQLFPAHREGVGKLRIIEGETMFLKMLSKEEHHLKSRQKLFIGHYLLLGCMGCLVFTSDLFLFDIITLAAIIGSAGVLNRILHRKYSPYVLEVVLLSNKNVRVRTLNSFGGSKSMVIPMENCNFGDLEHFTRINGQEFKVLYPKSVLFLEESDLKKYDQDEKSLRHLRYISTFKDVDKVQSSKDLFSKKKVLGELSKNENAFVKRSDSESSQPEFEFLASKENAH